MAHEHNHSEEPKHDHSHGHHHHHHSTVGNARGKLNRAFLIGILLNMAYVVIEAVFGFFTSSMGLLSDAGHNLSDVASLLIALIAFKAAQRKPNDRFTYGYKKATVEASTINAVILYCAVALIMYESIRKLIHPEEVEGNVVAWVAGAGVIVNGVTAWLFMKDSKKDLNVKGAFLHMVADTLVSVGVVVSGIVIYFTDWYFIDPIIGICISLMIAITSYPLLHESFRLELDAVPEGVDINKVKTSISSVPEINSFHHLHVWALSTTETAMTVHVVVPDRDLADLAVEKVRKAMCSLGITHTTVETETTESNCPDATCDSCGAH